MAFWTRDRTASTPSDPPAPAVPAERGVPEEPGEPGSAVNPPLSVTSWLEDKADVRMLQDLLHGVIDPEVGVNIVDLGLVYDIRVTSEGQAQVRMTLTTPGCPLSAYMDDAVRGALWGAPGVSDVDLQIIWDPPWSTDMMSLRAKQELGWVR